MYRTRVFSRHPSHKILRTELPLLPVRSVVRLGSITESKKFDIEINSVESIKISSNKKLTKEKFDEAKVKTAIWFFAISLDEIKNKMQEKEINFPIVAKSLYGSRGIGNTLLDDIHHLENWLQGKNLFNYIFEKFYTYSQEFRLHITKNGCFYTCRKALKTDADEDSKWRRHKDNSVWLLETNPNFNKPNSWDDIVKDCINALDKIGADILSFDIKTQSSLYKGKQRKYQDYILIESNSASSMNNENGISICAQKYIEEIPKLILQKANIN